MKQGTHQPRGCSIGKSCKDFHPKMCLGSCHVNHKKETKRVKENMYVGKMKNIPNFYQDNK